MTDPSHSGANGDTGVRDDESNAGMPRWVKVFGIIALLLIGLFVILHLTGRGFGGHRSMGM